MRKIVPRKYELLDPQKAPSQIKKSRRFFIWGGLMLLLSGILLLAYLLVQTESSLTKLILKFGFIGAGIISLVLFFYGLHCSPRIKEESDSIIH